MPSKQDTKKISEWKSQKVDRIVVEPRKEKDWPERIALAVKQGFATSRQDYIIQAVEDRLRRDGIPAETE